jgi:undecaprenol kinase
MKNNNIVASFGFACQGFVHAIRRERNFRFHLFASVVVFVFGFVSDLTKNEWIVILLCVAGMFCLELLNSSLERVVDLASPNVHELAKQAKDMSAAAFFLCASAIIGILIFYLSG